MRVIVWRWQHPGSAVGDNSKKRRRGSVFPWFCASCFWNLCCLQRNHESTSHKATKKPHSIRLVMFGQGWLGHAWSLRYLKIWMALWKNDDPHIPDLKRDNKQSCQAHGRRKGSPRSRDRLNSGEWSKPCPEDVTSHNTAAASFDGFTWWKNHKESFSSPTQKAIGMRLCVW